MQAGLKSGSGPDCPVGPEVRAICHIIDPGNLYPLPACRQKSEVCAICQINPGKDPYLMPACGAAAARSPSKAV